MTVRLPTASDGVRVERSHTRGRRRTVVSVARLEMADAHELLVSLVLDDRGWQHRDRVHVRTASGTLAIDTTDVNALVDALRRAKAQADAYRRTLRGGR